MKRPRVARPTAERSGRPRRPALQIPEAASHFSNRQIQLLEATLSHSKQTSGPAPNRQNYPVKNVVRGLLLALPIFVLFLVAASPLGAQQKRKVIIDQD